MNTISALRSVALLLACLVLAPTAPAQAPSPMVRWSKQDTHSFEKDAPGYGFSIGYGSMAGQATVYVYSMGITNWSNGITDPRLKNEVEGIVAGAREHQRRGSYSDLVFGEVSSTRFEDQDFWRIDFRGMRDGKAIRSGSLVGVRNGKLLKYRVTISPELGIALQEALAAIVKTSLADDPTR